MAYADVFAAYTRSEFRAGEWTRPIYRRGSGPAVIVIHEMPGPHPLVVAFADRIAAAGMTAIMPILFGEPGRPLSTGYALGEMLKALCVRREFHVLATGKTSPIVDWLRALAKQLHGECGGAGVGAVGMCFTGGFALAMMTEPAVRAPVLSQPSLPLPLGPFAEKRKAAIDISPDDLQCVKQRLERDDLDVLALRFRGDPFVPDERFATYRRELGARFESIELEPSDAKRYEGMAPHSVLTVHLDDGNPQGPTMQALARVLQYFHDRLVSGTTAGVSSRPSP